MRLEPSSHPDLPPHLYLFEEDRKLSVEEILNEAHKAYFHEGVLNICSVSAYFVSIPGCKNFSFESIEDLRQELEKFCRPRIR